MKKSSKITVGLLSLSILTCCAFFATTAGTLAWYAYSRSITVSYTGTSVAKSVLLNVGFVDDNQYIADSQLTEWDLQRETYDGHSIVFTHSTNGLDSRALREFLLKSGSSSSMLFPLTTEERTIDSTSPLGLLKSPEYGDIELTQSARPSDYVQIPFAFRIDRKDLLEPVNTQIWLTDVSIQASGENIDQAVRIFVEDKRAYHDDIEDKNKFETQRQFLFKPADRTTNTGATKVGGLLDLDGDGTYDFNRLDNTEYYYGPHKINGVVTSTVNHENVLYKDSPNYTNQCVNVNGVEDETLSTFYAKHSPEVYAVDLTGVEPLVAEYETFGTIKPGVNGDGDFFENTTTGIGKKICSTNSSGGVGYATFTIYIEGWDHVVVDKAAGYSFNLGLKFEVNRI